jgi:hypothetical protein
MVNQRLLKILVQLLTEMIQLQSRLLMPLKTSKFFQLPSMVMLTHGTEPSPVWEVSTDTDGSILPMMSMKKL